MHDGPYKDNSQKHKDYVDVMSDPTPIKYSIEEPGNHRQDIYGHNIYNKMYSQQDDTSPIYYGSIPSYTEDDTKSSISFSNSLLNPKAFMKRVEINKNMWEPKTPINNLRTYSPRDDGTSRLTFSSVSHLQQNLPDSSAKKPSLYSYFESKKTVNRERGNKVKSISKGDQNRRVIKTHKVSVPSIPSTWSDLVIGRWPNAAKRLLNLEKRRNNSKLSSYRESAMKNVDDSSTKKLRWLLNRTKRDVKNEKYAGI